MSLDVTYQDVIENSRSKSVLGVEFWGSREVSVRAKKKRSKRNVSKKRQDVCNAGEKVGMKKLKFAQTVAIRAKLDESQDV